MKSVPYGVAVTNNHGGTDYYVALAPDQDAAKEMVCNMGFNPGDVEVLDFTDMLDSP